MIESKVAIIKLAWLQVNLQIDGGNTSKKLLYDAHLYNFILKHKNAEKMAELYMDTRSSMMKSGITSKKAVVERLGWDIHFVEA